MYKLWQLEEGVKNAMAANDVGAAERIQQRITDGDYEEEGMFEYAWNYGIEIPQRFAQGVLDMGTLAVEGVADTAKGVADAVGLDDWIDEGEDNAAIEFARSLSQGSRDLMLESRFDDSVAHKASNVLGSVGGFIAAQRLGIGIPFAAATGVGTQSQMREQAKAEGNEVTGGDEALSRLLGVGLGLSERWTPKFILKGLPKTTEAKKFVDSWLPKVGHAATSAGIEGAQEALAGMGHEAVAQGLYNPDQKIGESLADDLTYGSFAGFTTDLVLNALAGRKQRKFYQQEEALRQQKSAEVMKSLEGLDEAEQQEVLKQLPFMPNPADADSEIGRVMSAANAIESSLGDGFPMSTQFVAEDGQVMDQDGNPFWQKTTPVEADMIAKRLNEVQMERSANMGIDLAIDQSNQAYTPGDKIGLRLFGKDLYMPSRQRRYDAGQVNFAGGTTDLNGFAESMSVEDALAKGIRPKDMTVAQRINLRRMKKGLPETQKFTIEEARAGLKNDFGNLSDFQYTTIPQDEVFVADLDAKGKPIVVSNYGLAMRSRKVVPKGQKDVFERRDFENVKAAELYAKRLNKMRDKDLPVRRSMLYEDGDISDDNINLLLKRKNINHNIHSREIRAIAEMVTGTKARGHANIKDKASLYTALRSLPRFSKPRTLPTFGLRSYSPAQYHAARQSVLDRGSDLSFDKPSQVVDKAEIEAAVGPVSDYVYAGLKKGLDADQALADEIADIRHADRVRQATEARQAARLAKKEPERQAELAKRADEYHTVMGAITGMLKGYGLNNVASRIERTIEGATDPLSTEGAYFWKTNEVVLAIDAMKANPRYQEAATDAEKKKVLEELAVDGMNHEMLHAMREADLFTEQEWNSLLRQVQKQMKPDTEMTYWEWANQTYPDLGSSERIAEEAVAEMTKDVMSGNLKIGGKPRSLINRIINFLRGMVGLSTDQTFMETMDGIRSGEIGSRPTVDESGKEIIRTYKEVARQGVPADMLESRQPGFPSREEQDQFLESRRAKDGRQNEEFFTGKAAKASSDIQYRPVIKIEQTPEVESYHLYTNNGNFTGHISKMIAGFAEKQAKVGQALVRALKVDSFLDIGASEGGLAKTVGRHRPTASVVALDPNPTMYENFMNTPHVDNVTYVREAFLSDGWEGDDGRWINGFQTDRTFDAINEDFTFQFISPDRAAQVAEVKRMLNPDGVFVTSEKFHTKDSVENEKRKLLHQSQYFSPDQLTEDKQTIITGMSDDMVSDASYEETLKQNFKWVAEYWNAGDFKGYIASDSAANIDKMLKEIGDLSTVYTNPADADRAVFSRRNRVATGESAGQYVGAPEGINSPQKLGGLIRRMTKLAEEGAYGRFWYEMSGRRIMASVNNDIDEADKLIQAIAVTSPNTPVDANLTYAIQAYHQDKAGNDVWTGQFPSAMSQKLKDIFAGREWEGRKTNNFYNNLMRTIDPTRVQGVTTDVWMMRAFGFWNDAPSDAQYTFVENETKRIAKKLGWEPQQVQAAIWVAMKARTENPDVRRATDKSSERNGWINWERDSNGRMQRVILNPKQHNLNWLRRSMKRTPTGRDQYMAKFDYADAVNSTLSQVSWETRPGRTSDHLQEAFRAPMRVLLDFHAANARAVLDQNGNDEIAKLIGIMSPGMFEAPGVWEGRVSPGTQTYLVAPRQYKGEDFGEVDAATWDLTEAYAASLGILFKQDAVGWHRPWFRKGAVPAIKWANGVEFNLGRGLTMEEAKMVSKIMADMTGHTEYSPVGTPGGFRLIRWNYLGDEGATTEVRNKEFQQYIKQLIDKLPNNMSGRAKLFHAQTGYLSNDWRKSPHGEDYIGTGRLAGRPDLQRRVQGVVSQIQPRVDAVSATFADANGWTAGAVYSRRLGENASRPGRRLPNFSEQGIVLGQEVVPGANVYDGIHYGRQETEVLRGDMSGTGIKGAEQQRLINSDDARIKRRVYFYIQRNVTDGFREIDPYRARLLEDQFGRVKARSEAGLGPHVFVQRFANILDPDTPEGVRIANRSLDNNTFESYVVDGGYDGYASPEQGMMVILNHDVPVQYLGLQTDLTARGNNVSLDREVLFPELQATGADAVFSRRGDAAKYRAERVSNIWSEFGYMDGRVIAAVATVDPDMFVHVTTGKREPADGYMWLKEQTTPLDVEQLASEYQTPFLEISREGGEWRITGHEGRHRMSAMSDAGIKKAPVVLKFKHETSYDTKESGIPEIGELLPQDFGRFAGDKTDVSAYTLPYEDLTDITWDNMDTLKERHGDDGANEVVFSRRNPNPDIPPADRNGPIAYRRVRQSGTLKNSLRKFWYRNFKSQGLLPQNVFDERVTRDSAVSAEELHIGFMNRDLERAARKAYGKPFRKLTASQQEDMQRYLMGEDVTLHSAVKEALNAQRAYLDALSTRMIETGVVTADESVKNILDNRGKYLHRSYQVFDDPNWAQNVPPEVHQAAFEYLTSQYRAAGLQHDPAFIEGKIGEILHHGTASDSVSSFISEGKLGTKDTSMLIQRKDIAKPIRDLMGEYHDPRLLFARSATLMQRGIANQIFQTSVKNQGLGQFLFEQPNGEFNVPLASEGSKGMDVLGGLYTTPEIRDAFIEATNPEQYGDTYRKIIAMNALVKYGKTVVAPTTMARNFISAFFFSMANGHANVLTPSFWRNVRNSGSMIGTTMMSKKDRRDYVLKLKRLGVTLDNPHAGEMIGMINDSAMLPAYQKGIRRNIKSTMDFFTRLYQYGDDFWKVIGFESEKAALMKHANMSEANAEIEAATRIRNTYPTYSLVGKGIKRLRRFPLAGTFVSFPAEIVRTAGNIVSTTAKDLSDPNRRPLAVRRIVGMSVATAWAHAAAALSMAMMGIDDDDDEAIRKLGPPWSRNSNLMYLGYDEDGLIQFMDISYTDPYNYLKRPLNALMTKGDAKETLKSLAIDVGGPFLGPDIAATALFETIFNKKLDGGRVFNPDGPADEQAQEAFKHIWGSIGPGVAGNIERMYKASRGDSSTYGKKYNMDDEISALFGMRKMTLSPLLGLGFKGFDYVDGMRNAQAILDRAVSGQNMVSDNEIGRKFHEMMLSRQRVAKRFIDQIEMTKKFSGEGNVYRLLASVVPSKTDAASLLNGQEPVWRFSGTYMKKARERLLAMTPPGQRKEALDRLQHRINLVSQLYEAYYGSLR